MKQHPFTAEQEKIIADAICTVASELRLIDVADLISMLRFERHGDLADLVASAAEMYFLPGTVKLGIGGDYYLDWGRSAAGGAGSRDPSQEGDDLCTAGA
ncbi:MAG: hypothetical protein HoeaKO_27950 [Hoeflea alexandrii]